MQALYQLSYVPNGAPRRYSGITIVVIQTRNSTGLPRYEAKSEVENAILSRIFAWDLSPTQRPPIRPLKGPDMVSANQLIWWIDATGILHACAQSVAPPSPELSDSARPIPHHYAQGTVNPASRAGTITHIRSLSANLSNIPRELFDILDARFPNTRWWIPDPQQAPAPKPVPAHS